MITLHHCPTFRARLSIAGCLNNQSSPNENTRSLCRACTSKIAGDTPVPERKTTSEIQSERARMVRDRHGRAPGKVEAVFKYQERPKRPGSVAASAADCKSATQRENTGDAISPPATKKRPQRGGGKLPPIVPTMKPARQSTESGRIGEHAEVTTKGRATVKAAPQVIVESGWVKASAEAEIKKRGRKPGVRHPEQVRWHPREMRSRPPRFCPLCGRRYHKTSAACGICIKGRAV